MRAVVSIAAALLFAAAGEARAAADNGARQDPAGGPPRDLFAQEIRLSAVLWPGDVEEIADPFWGEAEYRPRLTMRRSRVSAIGEVLLRAAVSGPTDTTVSPGQAAGTTGTLRRQADRQVALIRELSLTVDSPVDVVIGWQIVGWGHATDGLRPLDVFQRQDLTDRLRPEQLGVPAVTASYGSDAWDAEAVWVPSGPTDRIATIPSNIWYAFPPGFAAMDRSGEPAFSLSNGEAGVRVNWYGARGDLSVMAARTHDRVPSVVELQRDAPTGPVHPRPAYQPFWLVAAAAVTPVGSYVLRAEALWAEYPSGLAPIVKSGVRGVGGVERRFTVGQSSRYTAIFQYALDTTSSERIVQAGTFVSSPYRIYRHAATASLLAAWREQYELEVRGMRELVLGSTIGSAKFTYKVNDTVSMWVAADGLVGRAGTAVGRLDTADRVLAGVSIYP
jgi:hypothetical protein